MKKWILTAVAAGALAAGGAASAQDIGSVITNILGNLGATQSQQYGNVYTDQWGRQVYIDQYGRQVLVQPNNVYTNPVYDQWGQLVYNNVYGGYGYPRPGDRDGDGIGDASDHCPDDKTCW
jgi:hypothetical protein